MAAEPHPKRRFYISTDPKKLDLEIVHKFLATESEWAEGIPRSTLRKSIRNSLCFGLFHGSKQIGFARVISDRATIAYLGDVFVLSEYRGQGLSLLLLKRVMSHPDLQNLRRWILVTKDAHRLYQKLGFTPLARPEGFMELHNPGVYGGTKGIATAARY